VKKPPAPLDPSSAPDGMTWVKPELVCEVKYTEWTREGVLRQATFLRMRPDLAAEDCARVS
jgi:bifunctional non-homologous end joining protein LigD